jgi:PAS domain S-box-containing protein
MKDDKQASPFKQRHYIGGKVGAFIVSFVDSFVPPPDKNDPSDVVRRHRLLVASSFGMTLFALPFLVAVYLLEGYMSPTAWSLVFGCLLLSLNPFLLRRTRSHRLPGFLLALNLVVTFVFIAYQNGGHQAAILRWQPVIPLLATLLVGPAYGLVCTGLVGITTAGFYFLTALGYSFPEPLTQKQMEAFDLIGSISVSIFIGLLAWVYEQLRQHAMELAERATTTLRYNERYFRALIENSSDFISIIDRDGVIQYCNPAYERKLGYRPTELLGKKAATLVHPEDLLKLRQVFRADARDTSPLVECRVCHKDGSWRTLEANAENLLHDPAVRGFVINSRDITERKEVEQLKDELVSTVSHELRTPLTSLRGFAELMLRKEFSPEQRQKFLSIIHNESIRLTDLINDFLDLQRMESGRQDYKITAVSLDVLMREAAAIFVPQDGVHQLRLLFSQELPQICADADRLRQVLSNLLSNAVKYSPKGGQITLGARQEGNEVLAWVADQGVGIPQEALPRLFKKFFRVDNRDTRTIGGTGLGLALAKQIIEAHGGRMWVESRLGVGSTFLFTLPVAASLSPITAREHAVL